MKTAISIIVIACLCACTSTNEQAKIQPPRTAYTAPTEKEIQWEKLTDQQWRKIIQQLTDREFCYVFMNLRNPVEDALLKHGKNPFHRISNEFKTAALTHANHLFKEEIDRRPTPLDFESDSQWKKKPPLDLP